MGIIELVEEELKKLEEGKKLETIFGDVKPDEKERRKSFLGKAQELLGRIDSSVLPHFQEIVRAEFLPRGYGFDEGDRVTKKKRGFWWTRQPHVEILLSFNNDFLIKTKRDGEFKKILIEDLSNLADFSDFEKYVGRYLAMAVVIAGSGKALGNFPDGFGLWISSISTEEIIGKRTDILARLTLLEKKE